MKLLDTAQYDSIYSYVYSVRAKTRASRMKETVSQGLKKERLRYLQKYQLDIQEKIRKTLIGQTFLVLVDGQGKMAGTHKWKGRTNCNRIVHFTAEDNIDYKWKWVKVAIIGATALCLQGKLVQD